MKTYEMGIMGFIAFLFILVVGLQLGIYRGRVLEREEIKSELQKTEDVISILNDEIKGLEKTMADYEHALEVYQILQCESSYQHNVWGDNGQSFGIAQIQQRTFNWLKEKSGLYKLKWRDREDQIIMLSWAIKNGWGKLWSCYGRGGA